MKRRRHEVAPGEAGPLVRALAGLLEGGGAEAQALVARGAVYVNGRRCRQADASVKAGDTLLVVLEEAGRTAQEAPAPINAGPRILFEDKHLLAVDKPAGLVAQPTPGGTEDSLVDVVARHLGRTPGLVHRLDRETSGVTVFGRTPEATAALAAQFREGTAAKRYLAVCGPALAERGRMDLPLSRDPARPGRFRATRAANGVPAVTDWERLAHTDEHALVALFPHTGRTHQLRAHLTALGAPICGDRRYGGQPVAAGGPAGRCLLHAQGLQLRHPASGAPLLVEAPLPADMARVFTADGVSPPSGPWSV